MQIEARVAFIANGIYITLTGLTATALHAAGIAAADAVAAWAAIIALPVNFIAHGFSSTNPGPLAPPDPPKK
jgi:hypothetical protein